LRCAQEFLAGGGVVGREILVDAHGADSEVNAMSCAFSVALNFMTSLIRRFIIMYVPMFDRAYFHE
jgi:hypothetical protein